ncbi:glycosyltransferase [Lacinutrix salivirga]
MDLHLSFIIPVYNRPEEIKELLESFCALKTTASYEIVIVEDGSTISSKPIIDTYKTKLNIAYYFKENTGPGDSRNFGMRAATGNYFIILDSDCILPPNYLDTVLNSLNNHYVDCFGGPDAAHNSFTNLQKAINFAMTSFITTGGIRGKVSSINKFQPRSFNMGLSKKAFAATQGFGNIHPGEDPDLSIRLWNLGFETKLIVDAYVYHKRRISWSKFYKQVHKFGKVRPILNSWHPETKKITYWFPTLFIFGCIVALITAMFGYWFPIYCYILYIIIAFILALFATKSLAVAIQSMVAVFIQFYGYGTGFLKSVFAIQVLKKKPETYFPELFFKK